MKRSLASILCVAFTLAACAPMTNTTGSGSVNTGSVDTSAFGANVSYKDPSISINKDIAASFAADEAINLADIEKAYGLKLTAAQRKFLSDNKFLVLSLLDTSIRPTTTGDASREFVDLYKQVTGKIDYKERTQANSVFLTSDLFFDAYNNLFVELLKEMENKEFFPAMKDLSNQFYNASVQKLAAAKTDADKKTWTQVRNYFAVPYAIFSASQEPLSEGSYYDSVNKVMLDPVAVQAQFSTQDKTVDTLANATAVIKTLKLDATSEAAVLSDLKKVYEAGELGIPAIFKSEYEAYGEETGVTFSVDFSQFTPRGTYTSSSLRRAYFRGMNWYIQLPFFLKSPQLTTDAFAMTQLMAEHPDQLKNYNKLEAAINFLIGRSDDLMPADYLMALNDAKGKPDQSAAAMEYLVKARNPMIKSLSAMYSAVGVEQTDDVVLKTKGLRFFSGKFIIDSFWTGQLAQGDEAVKPGYEQKLPPYVSSLEVMALLGSDYARSQIPTLDFYKPTTAKAIDKAMTDLTASEKKLDSGFWTSNIYNGWLWTIKGLFSWQKENKASLPVFMQSAPWEIKTLQTGAGFWTQLRHASILYAKQSFAELGGGPPACDARQVPPAPKGYIEPQPLAYERLAYLTRRLKSGLEDQGFELKNLITLGELETALTMTQQYVAKELGNATLNEKISSHQETDDYGETCTVYTIDDGSDWENLRFAIVDRLKQALPIPTEGPILQAKDRREAIVADIHTGRDSENPLQIVYQGVGVPSAIITIVKDANGPRATIGFIYSHYEMRKDYGGNRMTDEDWQKNFYIGDETYEPYNYTDASAWPARNSWYLPLFPK